MNRTKTDFLELGFKQVSENGSGHYKKLGGQLINRVQKFKSVVQENGEIVKDVASIIICGWIKWQEAT